MLLMFAAKIIMSVFFIYIFVQKEFLSENVKYIKDSLKNNHALFLFMIINIEKINLLFLCKKIRSYKKRNLSQIEIDFNIYQYINEHCKEDDVYIKNYKLNNFLNLSIIVIMLFSIIVTYAFNVSVKEYSFLVPYISATFISIGFYTLNRQFISVYKNKINDLKKVDYLGEILMIHLSDSEINISHATKKRLNYLSNLYNISDFYNDNNDNYSLNSCISSYLDILSLQVSSCSVENIEEITQKFLKNINHLMDMEKESFKEKNNYTTYQSILELKNIKESVY